LKEYREVREFNEQRAEDFVDDCRESIKAQHMLSELCEGHNLEMQNLMREQSNNLKTFNLVEENVELLATQAKSLAVVRHFNQLEAEVTLAGLQYLTEIIQGPCKENQEYVAMSRKPVDVCKNILTSNFTGLAKCAPLLKWQLWNASVQLMASLVECRDDSEIQKLLCDQVPAKMLKDLLMKSNEATLLVEHGVFKEFATNARAHGRHVTVGDDEWYETLRLLLTDTSRCIYSICAELMLHEEDDEFASIIRPVQRGEEVEEEDEEGGEGGEGGQKEKKKGYKIQIVTAKEKKARAEKNLVEKLKANVPKLDPMIRSVEVFWNGHCVKAFFTLPKEWKSFSELGKKTFEDNADLSNSETRMKCLVDTSDDLYDEMKYQHHLTDYRFYSWFSHNYFSFKSGLYALVVLLNLNIMFSTFSR